MNTTEKNMSAHRLTSPIVISKAKVIRGRGRGKDIGFPTINIDLASIPTALAHGIYACRMRLGGTSYNGAIHYGPRPVFKDTVTFEVHIIGESVHTVPNTADITVVGFIRNIADFESTEALVKQIKKDIEEARGML